MEKVSLLEGLYRLRDEMDKVSVSGMENVTRFSACGDLLNRIIYIFQTAAESIEEKPGKDGDMKNARNAKTDKRSPESGYDKA